MGEGVSRQGVHLFNALDLGDVTNLGWQNLASKNKKHHSKNILIPFRRDSQVSQTDAWTDGRTDRQTDIL